MMNEVLDMKKYILFLLVTLSLLTLSSCGKKKSSDSSSIKADNWDGIYSYQELICPGKQFEIGPNAQNYEKIYYDHAELQVSDGKTIFHSDSRENEDGFVNGKLEYSESFDEIVLSKELAQELNYHFLKFKDTEFNKLEADFEDSEDVKKIFSDSTFSFSIEDFVDCNIRLYPAGKEVKYLLECWIDAGEGKFYIIKQTDVTLWKKN